MANLKDCLYGWECADSTSINVGSGSRVFEKDYCVISYAEGYILTDEKVGAKGKILNFISNGIGNWEDKVKSIQQNRLNANDIAYFVVPEINSVLVITKETFMLISQNKGNVPLDKITALIDQTTKTEVDKLASNRVVEINFLASNKNKLIAPQKFTLSKDANFYTFKIPDNVKCGDYFVTLQTNGTFAD